MKNFKMSENYNMKYGIIVTKLAKKMLLEIEDTRIIADIKKRINDLKYEPYKKGKALVDELAGFWSIRAVGQRYRIIYKVRDNKITVYVVAVGIRKEGSSKDIYATAKKLLNKYHH